jgi:hypothetical protein
MSRAAIAKLKSEKRLLLSYIFNTHVHAARVVLPAGASLKDVDWALVDDVMELLATLTDESLPIDLTAFVAPAAAVAAAVEVRVPTAPPFHFAAERGVREFGLPELPMPEVAVAAFELLLFATSASASLDSSASLASESIRAKLSVRKSHALQLRQFVLRARGVKSVPIACAALADRAAMLQQVAPTDFESFALFAAWQRRQVSVLVNGTVACLHGGASSDAKTKLVALRAAATQLLTLSSDVAKTGFLSSSALERASSAFVTALSAAVPAESGSRCVSGALVEVLAVTLLNEPVDTVPSMHAHALESSAAAVGFGDDADDIDSLLRKVVCVYACVTTSHFNVMVARVALCVSRLGESEGAWLRAQVGLDRLLRLHAKAGKSARRSEQDSSASDEQAYGVCVIPLVRDALQNRLQHAFAAFASARAFAASVASLTALCAPGDDQLLSLINASVDEWHRRLGQVSLHDLARACDEFVDAAAALSAELPDPRAANRACALQLCDLLRDRVSVAFSSGEVATFDRPMIELCLLCQRVFLKVSAAAAGDAVSAIQWEQLCRPICVKWIDESGGLLRTFAAKAPRSEKWIAIDAPNQQRHGSSVVDLCGLIAQLLAVPSELATIAPTLALEMTVGFSAHVTAAVGIYTNGAIAELGGGPSLLPASLNKLLSPAEHAMHRMASKLAPSSRRGSGSVPQSAPAVRVVQAPPRDFLAKIFTILNSLLWLRVGLNHACESAAAKRGNAASEWRALLAEPLKEARRAPRKALRAVAVNVVFEPRQPLRQALDLLWRAPLHASSVSQALLPALDAVLDAMHDTAALDQRLLTPLAAWIAASVLAGVWHALLFGGRFFSPADGDFLVAEIGELERFFAQGLPPEQVARAVRPLRGLVAMFDCQVGELAKLLPQAPPRAAPQVRTPFTKRNICAVLLSHQHDADVKELRQVIASRRADFDAVLAPAVVLTWLFEVDACADVVDESGGGGGGNDGDDDALGSQIDLIVSVLNEQQGRFD